MISVVLLTSLVLITILSMVQTTPIPTRKKMTITEALMANKLEKGFNGTWKTDTQFYMANIDDSIIEFDVVTQKQRKLISSDVLSKWMATKYIIAPDVKKILVQYETESIFRHSKVSKFDIYNIETNETHNVGNSKKLQLCIFAPTSDRLVYVMDNNVYVRQTNGDEIQLTKSGINGVVYIGIPDWVYEEEVLGSGAAVWFSPNGEKIAVGYFDDTDVKTYSYDVFGDSESLSSQYSKSLNLKYPKPGTPNPKAQLKVIDLTATEKGWTELKAPVDIVTKDNILRSVTWSDNDHVLVTWHNRRQNLGSIQLCDVKGDCKEVTRLAEPDGWIMAGEPKCLTNGTRCLMTNWIGNWYQIWNLDLKTGTNMWKSMGNFTVLTIYGYKESTNELYYQATTKEDITEIHVYKNDQCLSCSIKDIDGISCKHASAIFSKDFSHYALTCEGPTPTYVIIFESKTQKPIINWEMNEDAREQLSQYLEPKKEILQIPTVDGLTASVKLHFPPEINLQTPDVNNTKKYPLMIEVYGGPNHVRVKNIFSVGLPAYYSTSRDVVYAIIDPRGSGNKGKKSVYILNNHLGTAEIEDEFIVAKYLQEKFPFIDSERISIWGWSYGGYTSALTLARDSDHVFKCGVAVAPVVNWIYYDSIYTERFMGLPTKEDNLVNYEKSDITRNVQNFKDHGFLLIHGSADDNVHIQQTMILSKALQSNDILFKEMIYTDEAHGISKPYMHVMHTIEDFWNTCLKLN